MYPAVFVFGASENRSDEKQHEPLLHHIHQQLDALTVFKLEGLYLILSISLQHPLLSTTITIAILATIISMTRETKESILFHQQAATRRNHFSIKLPKAITHLFLGDVRP